MPSKLCGALTRAGSPCKFTAGECPHHGQRRAEAVDAPRAPIPTHAGPPAALAKQDERELAWWTVGEVLAERLTTSQGSVIASLLRIIHAVGPSEMSQEEALAEVEFRGRLMHGMPPRNDAEWARAESIFDADTVAEFRRWERLLERHRTDVGQP